MITPSALSLSSGDKSIRRSLQNLHAHSFTCLLKTAYSAAYRALVNIAAPMQIYFLNHHLLESPYAYRHS